MSLRIFYGIKKTLTASQSLRIIGVPHQTTLTPTPHRVNREARKTKTNLLSRPVSKVFASFLAVALARPGLLEDQDGLVSVSQSSLGTYKYSVQLRDSSRLEERLPDGTVIGEYTVPNELGVLQTFKYVAGIDGFRIIEGPLPVAPVDNGIAPLPVQETPEVFAARTALLQPVAPVIINPELPLPVTDTPEVRAAREEFLALHRAAALSNIV